VKTQYLHYTHTIFIHIQVCIYIIHLLIPIHFTHTRTFYINIFTYTCIYNPLIARVTHTHTLTLAYNIHINIILRVLFVYNIIRTHIHTLVRALNSIMSPLPISNLSYGLNRVCDYLYIIYCGLLLDSHGAGLALPQASVSPPRPISLLRDPPPPRCTLPASV